MKATYITFVDTHRNHIIIHLSTHITRFYSSGDLILVTYLANTLLSKHLSDLSQNQISRTHRGNKNFEGPTPKLVSYVMNPICQYTHHCLNFFENQPIIFSTLPHPLPHHAHAHAKGSTPSNPSQRRHGHRRYICLSDWRRHWHMLVKCHLEDMTIFLQKILKVYAI